VLFLIKKNGNFVHAKLNTSTNFYATESEVIEN